MLSYQMCVLSVLKLSFHSLVSLRPCGSATVWRCFGELPSTGVAFFRMVVNGSELTNLSCSYDAGRIFGLASVVSHAGTREQSKPFQQMQQTHMLNVWNHNSCHASVSPCALSPVFSVG